MRRLCIAAVCLLIGGGAAAAREMEKYCSVTGLQPSVRQSLIIVDEQHIVVEKDKKGLAENRDWRRFANALVDLKRTGIARDFLPRERVTFLVARRDGGGLTTLFTGCLPLMSAEEKTAAATAQGAWKSVGDFFGSSPAAEIEKDAERFLNAFRLSLVDAAQPDKITQAKTADAPIDSGVISSLKRSRAVDLTKGLPRIFLYSDLTRFAVPAAKDVVTAREAGLAAGQRAGFNLERAELYVVSSGHAGQADLLREYFFSFFLQTRAHLVDFNGAGAVANLLPNPTERHVFQGFIDYPGGKYPMRMRIAHDRNGTVVNSWVSVQSDIERFTPFGGILTCMQPTKCKFTGDKVFAQIWTKNPNPEPEFEAWMPFAGVREFEFSLDGDTVKGMAFDSAADIRGVADNRLRFELSRLQQGTF